MNIHLFQEVIDLCIGGSQPVTNSLVMTGRRVRVSVEAELQLHYIYKVSAVCTHFCFTASEFIITWYGCRNLHNPPFMQQQPTR